MLQGVITCVRQSAGNCLEAHIVLTDLKRVRMKLPWTEVQPYLFDNGGDPSALATVALLLWMP